MEIGLLNKWITFQVGTVNADQYGNHEKTYINWYSCRATVSGEGGSESLDAGEIVTGKTCSFTVRYCNAVKDITAEDYRIQFGNEYYNIISIDHRSYKNDLVKFKCERV